MKKPLKNLDGSRAQALDYIAESQAFLLVSCADPVTKTAPKLVVAIPDENLLTVSLAFLIANIPEFRITITNTLKRAEVMIGKMN